ncbi:MAG: PLP-dependent aminotransferase family protein [Paracoccaceae bacterium]|nr:PLP-dependent aminotransferase family protein [Paracoccaceae bacterium]
MAKQLAGALMPFVRIDPVSPLPKFRQIQDQLRKSILQGDLRSGIRLPASRILAAELGASRPTIVRVLESLIAEGYLEARQGAGTFVAKGLPQRLTDRAVRDSVAQPAPKLSRIGTLSAGVSADLGPTNYRPFLPNCPAYEEFPFAIWRKCWTSAIRAGRTDAMGYADPEGVPLLRQRIAEYLTLHRGDACDPDQIVVTSGSHAGFTLAALALANAGDEVWFEDPGPLTVYNLFRTLALQVRPVEGDANGMDVAAAVEAWPRARLAFTMPSRHHPLGVALSLPRRLALLEWARNNESWIIEDDYDSEFRYSGRPFPSMRSIDQHGRVVYVGTFSKALYPALRVGYLVLPRPLVPPFRALTALINRSVPTEVQLALAEFIGGGHFTNHLRRMRELYATRRSAFLEACTTTIGPFSEIDCPPTGMNAVLWLASSRNDTEICRRASEAGIQCFAMSSYSIGRSVRPALVLGFSAVPADKMIGHLARLADVLAKP